MEQEKHCIATYDALVDRALSIVREAPYWCFVGEPTYARLHIDGATATLVWPETDSSYDGCTIESSQQPFDAKLLLLSDDELAKWKVEQRAIYDREQAAKAVQQANDREAHERAVFEALKAKFETPK